MMFGLPIAGRSALAELSRVTFESKCYEQT